MTLTLSKYECEILLTDGTQKGKKKELYIEKEQSGEYQGTKLFWTYTAIIYSVPMPQHHRHDCLPSYRVLSAMIKSSILGTWQGIYFCEHRNYGGARELVLTLMGEE